MNSHLLKVYHRLPGPARSLVATLRGLYLRSWRYGPESERLVEEALERDAWTPAQWRTWRENRLAYVLHRAATQVPYYRQLWAKRRRKGDKASFEYLENWPVLEKQLVREYPRAFVAEDCDIRRMYHEHTSGTTGTPLDLWWSVETVRMWFALFEARLRRWNGTSRFERWGLAGGQPVVSVNAPRPPYWVWNAAMRQLYLSANRLSCQRVSAYVWAMNRYRIQHLIGYSSSMSLLASEVLRQGLHLSPMKVVLTNAEPLLPWQRDVIHEAFQCPVRETYGMGEAVAAASECASGTLHLWPEVGHIEVFDSFEPIALPPGRVGRLICTGLLNADMPLVRYSLGDRGTLPEREAACSCGRRLPAVEQIEGRLEDLLVSQDGSFVYWLNPVFYGLPVREAQIVQETLDVVRVRYVPAPEFNAVSGEHIADRLRMRMGDVQVVLTEVDEVPRESNGKFRSIVCQVDPIERDFTPTT